MQQISLAQTEYISNEGAYFTSTASGSCDTTITAAHSTEINDDLLFKETIIPSKLAFNMCIVDTSGDTPYISDYTIIAISPTRTCKLEMHSNGRWEDDVGGDC